MKNKSIPYDKYFDEMELTKKQKKKRKEFARKMERAVLFIFSLINIMREHGRIQRDYVIWQLSQRYKDVVKDYMEPDKHIEDYVNEFSQEIVDTTLNNLADDYYTSEDRAIFISENEANTTLNYQEHIEAIESGMTKKQWITEKDERVRPTHRQVDNFIIPIDRPFVVGDSLMMFPKDRSLGATADEVVNCRCTVKYL